MIVKRDAIRMHSPMMRSLYLRARAPSKEMLHPSACDLLTYGYIDGCYAVPCAVRVIIAVPDTATRRAKREAIARVWKRGAPDATEAVARSGQD